MITDADREAAEAYYIQTGFAADMKALEQCFEAHSIAGMIEGARLGLEAAGRVFMDLDNLAPEYDFNRLGPATVVKEAE